MRSDVPAANCARRDLGLWEANVIDKELVSGCILLSTLIGMDGSQAAEKTLEFAKALREVTNFPIESTVASTGLIRRCVCCVGCGPFGCLRG
jgi:hypothetical protein